MLWALGNCLLLYFALSNWHEPNEVIEMLKEQKKIKNDSKNIPNNSTNAVENSCKD